MSLQMNFITSRGVCGRGVLAEKLQKDIRICDLEESRE
jgi:hypothetical protein